MGWTAQTEPLGRPGPLEPLARLDLTEPQAQTDPPVLQVRQALMALLGLKVQQVLRELQAIKALQVQATKVARV